MPVALQGNDARLEWLDALRGYAIVGVILVHTSQYTAELPLVMRGLGMLGARGVQLFYIVSGFTIFYTLARSQQGGEGSPKLAFWVRRIMRIAPLYWFAIVLYFFFPPPAPNFWLGSDETVSGYALTANAMFVHGLWPRYINSVVPGGWSIGIEVLFYALAPFLFLYITTARRAVVWLVLSVIGALSVRVVFMHWQPIPETSLWEQFVDISFPIQAPVFLLGILLFFVVKDGLPPAPILSLSLVGAVLAGAIAFLVGGPKLVINHLVISPALFAFAVFSVNRTGRLWGAVPRAIGRVSYGIYLAHFAVLQLVLHLLNAVDTVPHGFWGWMMLVATVVPGAYFLAWGLKKLIEDPGIALGRWFSVRLTRVSGGDAHIRV